MSPGKRDFCWAILVLVLSGAAALGHQLLWTRRMADLIGATGESNARVFGCFFLGLSLGAATAARILPRIRRPWRTVVLIELGIAMLSLPVLLVNHWAPSLWPALGPDRLLGWEGSAIKWLLSLLAVSPPAFLVGMTLPVLSGGVCMHGKDLWGEGIWLYAAYTFGGAIGIGAVVGLALHTLGAAGSMLLMMGVNTAAAGCCLLYDWTWSAAAKVKAAPPGPIPALAGSRPPHQLLLVLSFFSGAGILAIEVAGLQLLNLKAPLAFYTPAAVLFSVVVLLACSAGLVAATAGFFKKQNSALSLCSGAAGLAIAFGPLLFLEFTAGRSGIGGHGIGFAGSLLQLGAATWVSLGPAVFLAGMVFPLVVSIAGRADTRRPGATFARLLAANGIGGLLGAEVVQRVLLPYAGVHVALGILGIFYGLISLGITLALKQTRLFQLAIPIGSVALAGWLTATSLHDAPVFLRRGTFNVLDWRFGREGTLAVVERPDVGRAMFLDNHYMLGCSAGMPDMQREAHVPLLLHRDPKRICFVGLGTGITAAGALKHRAIESIEVLELCPLVARAAEKHFGLLNEGITTNPRAKVHVEDARTYLATVKNRFDVIIGDLFTPWRPGETRLCSLEQFITAKAALRPGGAYCQWIPMTQLTRDHFETIARTFQHVFGEVYMFRSQLNTRSLPLALVGFKEGSLNWEMVTRRCEFERAGGLLTDPLCRHPEGLAMLYLGTYSGGTRVGGPANTLDNLRVELESGRHLIAGDRADYFARGSKLWVSFVDAQLSKIEARNELPLPLQAAPNWGRDISRLPTHGEALDMSDPECQRRLQTVLPQCIANDPGADWSLWPGNGPR